MVLSAAETVPLPWSVTVVKWEDLRKSALPLGSPHYLLHTCVASIQNGDPQLQSLNHHGAHLTCYGEIQLNHQGKRVTHTCWALPGLFNHDFIAQCESSVGLQGPIRNHGNHLCWRWSSEGPSLQLHAHAAELAGTGFSAFPSPFPGKSTQGIHCGKLREIIFTCLRKVTHRDDFRHLFSDVTQLSKLSTHNSLIFSWLIFHFLYKRQHSPFLFDTRIIGSDPRIKCVCFQHCHTRRHAE